MPRSSAPRYPTIRRYTPYTPPKENAGYRDVASPFSGQDFASALLQQQNLRKTTAPSSVFANTYDYDPILSKIQALSSQTVANAKTNAAQLRNEAAITEGDPTLLGSLKFDPTTIEAARQNPESLYAQLQKEFGNRSRELEDFMNNQNLFYSGEYTKSLSDLAQGRASAEGDIGKKLRDLLAGVDTGVLAAEETARQTELQAQLDLVSRANFSGKPVWDAKSGEVVYPTGWDHTTSTGPAGGRPTWFDQDGNGRTDAVPDGWVEHGEAQVDGNFVKVYGPPYSGPPLPVSEGGTVTTIPSTDSGVIDPISEYLGGGTFIT